MVSAYKHEDLPDRAWEPTWEAAAKGELPGVLWTEKRFSTKAEALEWAHHWARG